MNFIGNNNIRIFISFKSKLIDDQHKAQYYLDNLKIKFKDFNCESCYFKDYKSCFILKGYSNVSVFESFLQNLGRIDEFEKRELTNSKFYFDVKFLKEKDINLLKDTMKDIKRGTENWIQLVVRDRLFQFKFFDILSNYIYLPNNNCVRLHFNDVIDFNYATIEFANYIRDGGKDFGYPRIVKNENIVPKFSGSKFDVDDTLTDFLNKQSEDYELKKNRYNFNSNDDINVEFDNEELDLFAPDEPKNQGMEIVKTDEIIEDNSNFDNFFDNIKEETVSNLLNYKNQNLEDILNTFEND